jgi:hypothetical protein
MGGAYIMNILSSLLNFIANKIGNVDMGTSAATLTGAIAEHETQINSLAANSPAIFWKTGTYTGTLTSDNQWLNTTFAFPSKAGYSRHIIRTSISTSEAVVTGYSVENGTNYVSFRIHKFSASTLNVTVIFVAAYLKDSLQW